MIMPTQAIDLILDVEVAFFPPDAGGRSAAIPALYRPLCLIETNEGTKIVSLCELRLSETVQPGARANGQLVFAPDTSAEARRLLPVGTEFALAEGFKPIGKAVVKGILS